jgi:hypothetical protein
MESPPNGTGPKFELGQVVATPGAIELLIRAGRSPVEFIARHQNCDWGDLDAPDQLVNEQALLHGGRLLSSYSVVHECFQCIKVNWFLEGGYNVRRRFFVVKMA